MSRARITGDGRFELLINGKIPDRLPRGLVLYGILLGGAMGGLFYYISMGA
jgi:hypothetical protein